MEDSQISSSQDEHLPSSKSFWISIYTVMYCSSLHVFNMDLRHCNVENHITLLYIKAKHYTSKLGSSNYSTGDHEDQNLQSKIFVIVNIPSCFHKVDNVY